MAKDNKPILTGSQVIGAIALAVMLLAVLLIVNLVPQHTLRVQVWDKDDPGNLCEEENMISQHDMQVYALHVFPLHPSWYTASITS